MLTGRRKYILIAELLLLVTNTIAVDNQIKPTNTNVSNKTVEKLHMHENKINDSFLYKIRKAFQKPERESCKCVSFFENCQFEISTMKAKAQGIQCLINQKYCCKFPREPNQSGTKPFHTNKIEKTNILFNKRKGNPALTQSKKPIALKKPQKKDNIINATTLSLILQLLTDGYRFLTNFL